MKPSWIGFLAMVGGAATLLLAPFMVAIKYMTGWRIIPEPFWVPGFRAWLAATFPGATPAELWQHFGTGYSVALAAMLIGVIGLAPVFKGRTRAQRAGYWLVAVGLAALLPTTPSGALWLFSVLVAACGYRVVRDGTVHPRVA
jgi:hypothetical protein